MSRLLATLRSAIVWGLQHPVRLVLLGMLSCTLLMCAMLAWIDYCGRCELAAAIAETDREWPRWRLEELEAGRPSLADDQNSALIIAQAVAMLDNQRRLEPGLDAEYTELLFEYRPILNRRESDSVLQTKKSVLSVRQPAIDYLLKGRDLAAGHWRAPIAKDGVSTIPRGGNDVTEASNLLHFAADFHFETGNIPKGIELVSLACVVTGSIQTDPTLSAVLVRNGKQISSLQTIERALAVNLLNNSQLKQLEDIVNLYSTSNPLLELSIAQRAEFSKLFYYLRDTGDFSTIGAGGTSTISSWFPAIGPVYRYSIPREHAYFLRFMNRAVSISSLAASDQREQVNELLHPILSELNQHSDCPRLLICRWAIPAWLSGRERCLEQIAIRDCTMLGFSAERFRLRMDRWPKSVDELESPVGLPRMTDPFSEKSYSISIRPDGITIYSWGADGDDDGGIQFDDNDFGKRDIIFRLWNPDQRGLPPLPESPDQPDSN